MLENVGEKHGTGWNLEDKTELFEDFGVEKPRKNEGVSAVKVWSSPY